MLTTEELAKLSTFVNQSPTGTPYLRRAAIILMAEEGATQEDIAAEVQVPITHVRQLLRAFKRQGMALFPDKIWLARTFTADEPISDVARQIIADLVSQLEQYVPDLGSETSVFAVHETRKTIRTTRTALRLFEPYFDSGALRTYRKRASKFMRRLACSRDTAVFRLKLEGYMQEGIAACQLSNEEGLALAELARFWQEQQDAADTEVRRYLVKGKYQRLLADLAAFGRGNAVDTTPVDDKVVTKTRDIAPVMIYEKLGNVRAMGDLLDGQQLEKLHALRIATKELRYTLEFFAPLMGTNVAGCLETVKQLLTHLGDVNDARVHLEMLEGIDDPGLARAVELYRAVVADQLQQLKNDFPTLWMAFDQNEWRNQLAAAVAGI